MKPTTDKKEAPKVRSLFLEALDKTTGPERAAYLDQACGPDAQLRARVEILLKAHDEAGRFLLPPGHSMTVGLEMAPPPESPGTVIGRYKLLEKIGEGGMAVVYMAEQTEPIRRKVALKIIKLGMDTRQVIARFEAERQALALMDHPSIAKVLDAGATETGRPYFVMELVQGVSITEYCDKNNLSTKDRLALFLQVCHAVQHAHQKGIIHRDIKPSNVMVTHHDGKPVPKVIDFGIAKATNQKLTEKTLFTRYAHLIGTPTYMSPEQAELSDLDIDTRSDIYSLGVLLYELLTGTTPFSEEELRKAGYIEMQRVIREQEPAKPSTRIRTATRDRRSPDRLSSECQSGDWRSQGSRGPAYQQVRGDLDWIVMKSLEKDRARRYETASGLAEDLRRHLEHEPVLARGPSTTYRLHKFVRRHRVEALALLALAIVAGAVVVILSMWNRDRLQLAEAEGFKHRNILSQAREQYAKVDREAALETIRPILNSKHVGPEVELLRAGILADNRRSEEAVSVLRSLLDGRAEVAGAAHALLARILWETGSPNAEKLKEIEEHRRQAEALLPETAEAYFLRAMTAITIQEQLVSLDKALRLDPSHYESRRLRAFTYYASRKYDRLQDDALVLTVLRPRDALGYSLRAIAWWELGRYREAIADYDIAIGLTPQEDRQYAELSVQRSETLLRMGEYERVIAEAPIVETQDLASPRQYHVFSALTALGDYDKAATLFRQIISPGHEARRKFQDWCSNYVFDTLEAGRSWHPADREPVGAAFLPMVEAEETYRSLSAKGRRVTTEGFSADWSPDGSKLAFSLGVQGYSGVALFDPATKETELLIVPGKDPRWSPDGEHIAFVRDRQFLRVSEFIAAERKIQDRVLADEEVWVMRSDGTEPRRLVRGGWSSWSQDSTTIYYHSRIDNALCSISIMGQDAQPKRIMPCPNAYPSVSPDNQRVAYLEGGSLKIRDLVSQTLVAERLVPSPTWGGAAWSPNGRELCLAGRNDSDDRTGLWIYSLDKSEPARVLEGQITVGAWVPDGTKLAFCLGPPYFEVWAADLDPSVSTIKALGPGQMADEHFQAMAAVCTRRIEADPLDAYAYSDRAHYYEYLHDRTKANADMALWSAIQRQRAFWDFWFGATRSFRHVLNMPFDCQVVFSAERPVDEIPVVSVAFGQKGRCEMKPFEIPMWVTSLLGLCLLVGPEAPPAHAHFTLGPPVNVGPNVNSSSIEAGSSVSADGLSLYFGSDRPGGYGGWDLWVTTRATLSDPWGAPVNLGPIVNTSYHDCWPSITADGLSLYFSSKRPGGYGDYELWVTTRATTSSPWGPPVNLGPTVNSSESDLQLSISADGLTLYIASDRPGTYGSWDLWVTTRGTLSAPWGSPVNLGPTVNSPQLESNPSISADGLLLFFDSGPASGASPFDLYVTRRPSLFDPWGTPVNLGPTVNTPSDEFAANVSTDGRTLYFTSDRPGGYGSVDIWQAPIIPIVDFNGDQKIDLVDLVMLIDDWGKTKSVCDIGPMPWGDGKVDIEDLKVFMTYYEKANPSKSQDGQ